MPQRQAAAVEADQVARATAHAARGPEPSPEILEALHHYRYPVRRKLQCCFFWTSNTVSNNAPAYAAGARKLLEEHGRAAVSKAADALQVGHRGCYLLPQS